MHATRNYPDWYPKEKRYDFPLKMAVSATNFPIVTRVIEPKLFSFLPRNFYRFKRTPQGYLQRITFKDGGTLDILTGGS